MPKLGTSERKGFTNGQLWVATEKDCKLPWGGKPRGVLFRCFDCGHKFKPGDQVRWQFTNDVDGACGNPFVCEKCDGTKEEIVAKIKELREIYARMWWFHRRTD